MISTLIVTEPRGPQRPRQQSQDELRLCNRIGNLAAEAFGVFGRELRSAGQGRARVAFACQVGIHCHVVFGLSLTDFCNAMGANQAGRP